MPIEDSPLNSGVKAAGEQLRPEEVVFALRDAATNKTSFLSGNSAARARAAIIAEHKRRDLHD